MCIPERFMRKRSGEVTPSVNESVRVNQQLNTRDVAALDRPGANRRKEKDVQSLAWQYCLAQPNQSDLCQYQSTKHIRRGKEGAGCCRYTLFGMRTAK